MTFHIIRPWRNTKILRVWKFFSSSHGNSRLKTWFCNCPQYLCLFHIVFEYSPSIHDQWKTLVLPNRLLPWVLSTSDQCFVSFQPIWCHPHTQIRRTLVHGVRKSIPNLEPSPNRAAKGFSQIAFPITVLPKDDRTDFAQEERLGLPLWTMIWAICVVVDESRCLDIPIWEFSIICEHPPFLPGYTSWYCVSCLSCATRQSWDDIHDFCYCHQWCWWSLSFVMLSNRLLQYHPGVQLDLCIFGALPPIQYFSNDICLSVRRNELLSPSSLLHRSPLSYFWLSSGSTPKISPIFPIPCPLLPLLREFSWLEA